MQNVMVSDPPRPAGPAPRATPSKLLGVMPKVTGYDLVIWLHRGSNDQLPFLVATPDRDYTDSMRAVFNIEPMLMQVSPQDKDFDVGPEVTEFVDCNLSTILRFWEGELTNPEQVISLIRKASPRR